MNFALWFMGPLQFFKWELGVKFMGNRAYIVKENVTEFSQAPYIKFIRAKCCTKRGGNFSLTEFQIFIFCLSVRLTPSFSYEQNSVDVNFNFCTKTSPIHTSLKPQMYMDTIRIKDRKLDCNQPTTTGPEGLIIVPIFYLENNSQLQGQDPEILAAVD